MPNEEILSMRDVDGTISSPNCLKALSAVVHFIQKVGKEIIFEFDADSLSLQTLNDAKSAFAVIEFPKHGFFDKLALKSTPNKSFACKIAVKPLCSILSPRNLKIMKTLRVYTNISDNVENEIVFEFICNRDIRRIHRFPTQDTEVVSAVFDDTSPTLCSLRSVPKVFCNLLEHTQAAEISIEADRNIFRVKSFHQEILSSSSSSAKSRNNINSSSNSSSRLHRQSQMTSAMSLETKEFEEYNYRRRRNRGRQQSSQQRRADRDSDTDGGSNGNAPEELIFCVREVKSFLGLCEASGVDDFTFQFSESGRPVKFSCCLDAIFTAQLVMATMVQRSGDDVAASQEECEQEDNENHVDVDVDVDREEETGREEEEDGDGAGEEGHVVAGTGTGMGGVPWNNMGSANDNSDQEVDEEEEKHRHSSVAAVTHVDHHLQSDQNFTSQRNNWLNNTGETRASQEEEKSDHDNHHMDNGGEQLKKRRTTPSSFSGMRSIICSDDEDD
eukprot:gene1343-2592_t